MGTTLSLCWFTPRLVLLRPRRRQPDLSSPGRRQSGPAFPRPQPRRLAAPQRPVERTRGPHPTRDATSCTRRSAPAISSSNRNSARYPASRATVFSFAPTDSRTGCGTGHLEEIVADRRYRPGRVPAHHGRAGTRRTGQHHSSRGRSVSLMNTIFVYGTLKRGWLQPSFPARPKIHW